MDLAAAFQTFHWFDADRALAEFRRIARRRIALVQYERDEGQAFARDGRIELARSVHVLRQDLG